MQKMRPVYQSALFAVFILGLSACNNAKTNSVQQTDSATMQAILPADATADRSEPDTSNYAVMYIAVADTGIDYYLLRKELFSINGQLHTPIDTMGRYFDDERKKIILPDDDEDEIYRGDYFPRRGLSTSLSLEYYNFYSPGADTQMIALVAGIYEQPGSADSAIKIIGAVAPRAFVIRSNVYAGCMH